MRRPPPLPPRSIEEVIAAYPRHRQSMLGTSDNCLLSARFDLEGRPYTNHAQARGIIGHRIAAEIMRTLQATGEVQIPSEEAVAIMREVCRQRDLPDDEEVVVLPVREQRLLRIAIIRLAGYRFNTTRLIDVEARLSASVRYVHPEYGPIVREFTGKPDALLADPPDGAVVLDWKFSPSAPAARVEPPEDEWRGDGDHLHVSYQGYWQQRAYAWLVMKNYPSVQRVTLREFYPLPGEARSATITRDGLEHIEAEITERIELLDRALEGGHDSPLWQPSPGRHCSYCRNPAGCPLEPEVREREGGITSPTAAARVAGEFVVADEFRTKARAALKNYVDETGQEIPVKSAKGRYVMRWGKDSAGRRKFGMHVPEKSDRGPADVDLAAAFEEAAAAREEVRA